MGKETYIHTKESFETYYTHKRDVQIYWHTWQKGKKEEKRKKEKRRTDILAYLTKRRKKENRKKRKRRTDILAYLNRYAKKKMRVHREASFAHE